MLNISRRQTLVFVITFFCMASRRSSLEGWSILKPEVSASTEPSATWLGVFDTMYMFSYAIGELINGHLSDKYAAHKTVSIGLLGTGLSLACMSILSYCSLYSAYVTSLMWLLSGYSQSAVYPGCTKIMGQMFKRNLGKIMGVWTSNTSSGNILGALLVTIGLGSLALPWEMIMIFISGIVILAAGLVWVWGSGEEEVPLEEDFISKESMSFVDAFKIKGLVHYAVTCSCVKMINYSVMMWLPLYMSQSGIAPAPIGIIMIMYEVAGGIGSIFIGWITDKLNSRLLPLILLVLLTAPVTLALNFINSLGFFCVAGVLLGCAHISILNIISGVVSIELGKQNVGLVTGIIDGTASFATGVGMMAIGLLQALSWNYVWGVFVLGVNLVAAVPLVLLHIRNTKTFNHRV